MPELVRQLRATVADAAVRDRLIASVRQVVDATTSDAIQALEMSRG